MLVWFVITGLQLARATQASVSLHEIFKGQDFFDQVIVFCSV